MMELYRDCPHCLQYRNTYESQEAAAERVAGRRAVRHLAKIRQMVLEADSWIDLGLALREEFKDE